MISVCPSVCLSVHLSVCSSWLFFYYDIFRNCLFVGLLCFLSVLLSVCWSDAYLGCSIVCLLVCCVSLLFHCWADVSWTLQFFNGESRMNDCICEYRDLMVVVTECIRPSINHGEMLNNYCRYVQTSLFRTRWDCLKNFEISEFEILGVKYLKN